MIPDKQPRGEWQRCVGKSVGRAAKDLRVSTKLNHFVISSTKIRMQYCCRRHSPCVSVSVQDFGRISASVERFIIEYFVFSFTGWIMLKKLNVLETK